MRVLIISMLFHPSTAIGAKRPTRLAKYLTDMGDNVDVICPHHRYLKQIDESEDLGDTRIFGTSLIRVGPDSIFGGYLLNNGNSSTKISTFFSKLLFRVLGPIMVPDRSMPWIPIGVYMSLRVIRKFKPDVIYVSCPEYGANVIGAIVQRITGIPLVIDYDDPWHLALRKKKKIRRFFNRKIETLILHRATHVIANTNEMAEEIKNVYSSIDAARSCSPIHASFVNNKLPGGYRSDPKEGLKLAHAGSLYAGRSATTLVKAMLELKKWTIKKALPPPNFTSYGRLDSKSKAILEHHNGMDMLSEHAFIPYDDCMQVLLEADVLVLFVAPHHKCQIPGKLFDYISCKRPIIAFVGPGDSAVKRIMNETEVGWVIHIDDVKTTQILLSDLAKNKSENQLVMKQEMTKLQFYRRRDELEKLRDVLLSASRLS